MKKHLILSVALVLTVFSSFAQIWQDPIVGTNPSASNPFNSPAGTTGLIVDPNVTVSGISRGTGINANAGADRYNSTAYNIAATTAPDLAEYFEFTLTPASGYHIEFNNLNFTYQRSATASPSLYSLRSSLDGYAADIATGTLTGTTSTGTNTVATIIGTFGGTNLFFVTTPITFRLYPYGATTGTSTFSINQFSFNGNVSNFALPLNLLTFAGRPQGSSLTLEWTTGCESGMLPFEVEKSTGGGFGKIGTVAATNNGCSAKGDYQFTDNEAGNGTQLYRLKMTEFSGKVSYSSVLRFNGKAMVATGLTISPNPATDYLQVSGLEAGTPITISDASGRIVIKSTAGGETASVPVQSLQSGLYFLQTPGSAAVKFVKQ